MARPPVQLTDPRVLKPVVESLIFASEEPLPPRALVRLLVGEPETAPGENGDTEPGTPDPTEATATAPGDAAPEPSPDPAGQAVHAGPADPSDPTDHVGAASTIDLADDAAAAIADFAEAAALEQMVVSTVDAADPVEDEAGTTDKAGPATDDVSAVAIPGDDAQDLADAFVDVQHVHAERQRLSGPIETLDQRTVRMVVDELNDEYEETGRAFRIVELAGGFQFATLREYGEWVALLSKERQRRRLSPAALETLSIIAYRQPIAKPEIEAIRGVNSDQVLLSLLEKNLIAITGRSETVGRPLLYGTTDDFLRAFGLNTLNDLPKLREIEELMEVDAYSAEKIDVVNIPESSEAAEIEALVGAAGNLVDERELREALATGQVPAEPVSEQEHDASDHRDEQIGRDAAEEQG